VRLTVDRPVRGDAEEAEGDARPAADRRRHYRGTLTFVHISGEGFTELDHGTRRWGRSLKRAEQDTLVADPSSRLGQGR